MFFYIPACYFPSTVVLGQHTLYDLDYREELSQSFSVRLFDSYSHIINFLTNNRTPFNNLKKSAIESNHHVIDTLIDDKLGPISDEIYHENRFNEASVLVLHESLQYDAAMSIFNSVTHTKIKKLYITSQPNDLALKNAVSHGAIHKVVTNNINEIKDAILELQYEYFRDMSASIMHLLHASVPDCLLNHEFINFFNKLCKSHDIVEYYLIDSNGSFLLLDRNANVSALLVNRDDVINTLKLTDIHCTNLPYKNEYNSFFYIQDFFKEQLYSYNNFLEVLDIEERLLSV